MIFAIWTRTNVFYIRLSLISVSFILEFVSALFQPWFVLSRTSHCTLNWCKVLPTSRCLRPYGTNVRTDTNSFPVIRLGNARIAAHGAADLPFVKVRNASGYQIWLPVFCCSHNDEQLYSCKIFFSFFWLIGRKMSFSTAMLK